MRKLLVALAASGALLLMGTATASTPGADARLTNDCHPGADCGAGYSSAYTLATGEAYTDPVLDECTIAHGRQNEPSVALDPRNPTLLLGSSNDYCGVYAGRDAAGNPAPTGPVWLGYYRSLDGGASWTSSLVPGYPGDTSPYAALSQARTAGAGDPVIAWDGHGRAYFGSESSGDPSGSAKTFGDVWVATFDNPTNPGAPDVSKDGLRYRGTTVVAHGSSAPNLLGVFHDKTAIEVDRTGGPCDGTVYFAWARFTAGKNSNIYLSRSTDHGATFSSPQLLTPSVTNVQDPEIDVTGNGHVYVTFDAGATNSGQPDGSMVTKSTDCGATFGPAQQLVTYTPYAAQDVPAPEAVPQPSLPDDLTTSADAPSATARDCGDFADHCASDYTFFRRATTTRSAADQYDRAHEWLYVVYDATKPGTEVPTGTTYGSITPGTGSQSATYFVRYDGVTGAHTAPMLLDDQAVGHQTFPDISADGGVLHTIWWDSRNDPCYSPTRPIGNCADRTTVPSLDVYATSSSDAGTTWGTPVRVTDVTSNPNHEQFDNRAIPFAGDYLWVTSLGATSYGTWTDWRNTVQGTDPREAPEDADATTSDVVQCRVVLSVAGKKGATSTTWSGDRCPHAGGLDQDIYGDATP